MSQLDQGRQLNAFTQTKTVFSGADPALAQLEGGAGIIQGTDPTSYVGAVLDSWSKSGQPGGSASEASTAINAGSATTTALTSLAKSSQPGLLTTAGLVILAVGLVLIGAWAMLGEPAPVAD